MEARHEREEFFTEAIRQHRAAMFRVAHSMLRSDADAEDAVAAATLSAWQHLSSLHSWGSVRPWLMRITVNVCHAALRKRKREVPFDMQVWQDKQTTPEETPLWMYIEMLPQNYAAIMQMRFGEGMTLEEICEALRLSKGTVSSRLTRGKQELKRLMEREADRS